MSEWNKDKLPELNNFDDLDDEKHFAYSDDVLACCEYLNALGFWSPCYAIAYYWMELSGENVGKGYWCGRTVPEDVDLQSEDARVVAWMPLPKPPEELK